MEAIDVIGISKYFKEKGKKIWALKGVNLSIRKGIIFSLLGPNGAGKSTLLNIMTNVLSAEEGKVIIFGKDVAKNIGVLEKVGFMSSESRFHWSLKPKDILNFYGKLYGLKKEEREKRIRELMKDFDLKRIAKKSFAVLSTGERARLILAKSLIHQPKIVLLDEPTSGLDPEMARRVRRMIKKINKEGVTVILTSHNMPEVEQLSDEIGFIYKGKIVDVGDVEEVKLKHFAKYDVYFKVEEIKKKNLLIKSGFSIKGRRLKKTLEVGEDLGKWLGFLHLHGLVIKQVEAKRPSLEDYFVKIMKR